MGRFTASISTSLIASLIASPIASLISLNLGVACARSCWPIFGFRTSWVLAGGTEGSFLCSLSSRFSGRGGGVGASPGRGGELGCHPLRLNPSSADGHHVRSVALRIVGRTDEGIAEMKRAVE